jgi:hypothetical protein
MSKIILVCLLALIYVATIRQHKTKVYLILSYRANDLSIERVFLKKKNAEKYCDMYKNSHNYSIEERELTE